MAGTHDPNYQTLAGIGGDCFGKDKKDGEKKDGDKKEEELRVKKEREEKEKRKQEEKLEEEKKKKQEEEKRSAEARLSEAVKVLEELVTATDSLGWSANSSLADDALSKARQFLATLGEENER